MGDGVFYEENALEKFRRGDLDTSITYVLGVNSYEGNLWEMYGNPAGTSFPSVEGMVDYMFEFMVASYAENNLTNAEITEQYITEFNAYLPTPVSNFTDEQMMAIGGQIFGDYFFRLPAM